MTILERWGLSHINRYLNNNTFLFKHVSIQSITRAAVILSFAIGFVITLLVVLADMTLFADLSDVISSIKLLSLLIAINVVLVAIEFWLLFHLGFYTVARYITKINQQSKNQMTNPIIGLILDRDVKASLVRAILELNEPTIKRFGLNPYRKVRKHYWLILMLYKAKVILSNAMGKLVARKLLTRMGLRTYAPLISTLITGWWDAWIQNSVLKEVRFRLSGRLYALHLIHSIKMTAPEPVFIETIIRLLALRIECYGLYNINLDYLIVELDRLSSGSIDDFTGLFDINCLKNNYEKLSVEQQNDCSEIACNLMAFKCSGLSLEERNLLSVFNIKTVSIITKRQDFNRLFAPVRESDTQSFFE